MIRVITTARANEKPWQEKEALELNNEYCFNMDTINVDTSKTFQTHMGFGGAFTEAAAYTFANTNEENKKAIIEAYFNKEKGLGYNLGRTTIHGCDFSLEPYTYIEEGDDELKTYSIARDEKWIIPMIKAAEKEAGHRLELLCSPWSPPAFMKDNKDINHGGRLLKEYYMTWARYMAKYVQEMNKRGIELAMISIQNEPEAIQTWASCEFNHQEEAEFAVDYLYNALKELGLENKVKIVVWDHNKDNIYKRVKTVMNYKDAKDKVWGVAYHWYVTDNPESLTMVHESYPDMHIMFTEGCVEIVNTSGATSSKAGMGAWSHGETYGRNIINDFNNYNEAWIDWNLILDEIGGPNYVGNYCEAPILVDRNTDEVVYNWSYYYLGHFSRYIAPGAKRVLCRTDAYEKVYVTAYKNPDGQIVVVAQNELDDDHNVALVVDGKGVNTKLPAHSITTFVIE